MAGITLFLIVMSIIMGNDLYKQAAAHYNLIADDRCFRTECEHIDGLLKPAMKRRKVLELFAGPAYHGRCFAKHYDYDVYCIDNSKEMAMIATQSDEIDGHKYKVGTLPDALDLIEEGVVFDLVLIMRYSLGLISRNSLAPLFAKLDQLMAADALVLVEGHDITMMMNGFNNTEIKARQKTCSKTHATVSCKWPSGDIVWDKKTWKVMMPIELQIETDGELEVIKTQSEEYVHLESDILSAVQGREFKLLELSQACRHYFNQSVLTGLTKG